MDKEIIELSRKDESIVRGRYRNLTEIQKCFGEGSFWNDIIFINNNDIYLTSQSPDTDAFTYKLFTFGLSISKALELGNTANAIKALLQMFEEYSKSSKRKITEQVVANSNPQNYASLSKQKELSLRYDQKMDIISKSLSTVRTQRRYSDNFLAPETTYANYDEYIEVVKMRPRIENEAAIKPNKLIKPSHLKVLVSPPMAINLNLSEVVRNICDVLMLLYNKFYDQQILSRLGIKSLEKIDRDIKKAIIEPLMSIIVSSSLQTLDNELGKIHDILMHN